MAGYSPAGYLQEPKPRPTWSDVRKILTLRRAMATLWAIIVDKEYRQAVLATWKTLDNK